MQCSQLLVLLLYIGYTSNNWSTSEIPLDQYQEKLWRRTLSDWKESEWKEVQLLRGLLQEREREFYQEQPQREIKEKEQIQYLQQEKAALIQKINEDITHLKETKATLEEQNIKLQKELHEEKQLMSRLMKRKENKVNVSEKDEEIESLKNKVDEEKKEEKKLRQELQEKVESLQQLQLQRFIIPQSSMCVCTGS